MINDSDIDMHKDCPKGMLCNDGLTKQEIIGAVLDQVFYAMRYQHGENVEQLRNACALVLAHARLIASAPELLEACKYALEHMVDPLVDESEPVQRLKQAVKKAEGK